jgi:hypothetical protein
MGPTPGVETPITPVEPDVLDGGDGGVEGLWVMLCDGSIRCAHSYETEKNFIGRYLGLIRKLPPKKGHPELSRVEILVLQDVIMANMKRSETVLVFIELINLPTL